MHCQSKDAKKLCIHDPIYKLKHSKLYDIGGTYTYGKSDLWFYMTTWTVSENSFLLNLFVQTRKMCDVSITVSFNGVTSTKILKNRKDNQNHHLKTFCITTEELNQMSDFIIFVPISIDMHPSQVLNPDVIRSMKLNFSLCQHLLENEKMDFVLKSASGKEYPIHKLLLAAHSSVLREIVKDPSKSSACLDITDEDMELLIGFLYVGTINDIQKKDCMRLQEVAAKFQLSNLFLLAQYAISHQINSENAVNIALIAKKYNLEKLWSKVCSFIKRNPDVMETDGWKSLDDVELAKQLCTFFVK